MKAKKKLKKILRKIDKLVEYLSIIDEHINDVYITNSFALDGLSEEAVNAIFGNPKNEPEIKQKPEPKQDNEPEQGLCLENEMMIEIIQKHPKCLLGKYKKINNCNMVIYNVCIGTNGSIYFDCKDNLNGAVILQSVQFNPKYPIFNDVERKDIFFHGEPFIGPETVLKQLDG